MSVGNQLPEARLTPEDDTTFTFDFESLFQLLHVLKFESWEMKMPQ
jgi:hypothetical protein